MVNEPSMKTSVAVFKRMNINESKREGCGDHNGINAHICAALVIRYNAIHQTVKIFSPRADMHWDGFLRPAVMRAHKSAFGPQSQVNEPCIPDDNPLFFFQAEDGIRDLTVTGVQMCALPI